MMNTNIVILQFKIYTFESCTTSLENTSILWHCMHWSRLRHPLYVSRWNQFWINRKRFIWFSSTLYCPILL